VNVYEICCCLDGSDDSDDAVRMKLIKIIDTWSTPVNLCIFSPEIKSENCDGTAIYEINLIMSSLNGNIIMHLFDQGSHLDDRS